MLNIIKQRSLSYFSIISIKSYVRVRSFLPLIWALPTARAEDSADICPTYKPRALSWKGGELEFSLKGTWSPANAALALALPPDPTKKRYKNAVGHRPFLIHYTFFFHAFTMTEMGIRMSTSKIIHCNEWTNDQKKDTETQREGCIQGPHASPHQSVLTIQ